MPWPSEPFTSARVISSAMIFASGAGTWTASKARAMNASRSCALMRSGSGIPINRDVVPADNLVPAFRFRSDRSPRASLLVLVFLQLDQRTQKILRMHEGYAGAVDIDLRLAVSEHACTLVP